jgi:organic hydroperoxide reductase OsmC/OhrA
MEQSSTSVRPKLTHKTFTYQTRLSRVATRACMLSSEGKQEFRVASPPEFKGEEGVWSPEDLLVGAVNVCVFTTFAAFAERKQLPVVSYQSEAEGFLEHTEDGYQFTRVIVRPQIVVESLEHIGEAQEMIEDSHKKCLISNSIKGKTIVEPIIKASDNL